MKRTGKPQRLRDVDRPFRTLLSFTAAMFFRLVLLFTLIPLVEVLLLVWIAGRTSFGFTVGLVVGTGVLGAWLARREGFKALSRIRSDVGGGRMPGDALFDGVLILVAGAVLLTPGILTDLAGFSLLVPPIRRSVKRWLKRRFAHRVQVHPFGEQPFKSSEIIHAEVIENARHENTNSR